MSSQIERAADLPEISIQAADHLPAYQEDQVSCFALRTLDEVDEFCCIESAAIGIEEDLTSAGMSCENVDAIRPDLPHFAGAIARRALDELGCDRVGVLVTGFADEIKEDTQAGLA